ncbi:helix-turn-helix domain-containing protein [Enterococcus pingfangensis]|uniref:helix-turn-helix domain-containing protein n=1 Tax=Enterococcus pingfangensis TaxID=2559924 RepID=UPI0010F6A4B9|nr:AraC family transcriptional regulator [Enterococcus pingfangensis]
MQKSIRQFHYINEQHFPLIQGIGIGQGSINYHWDASLRKEQLIVLQVTLKGQGFIQVGEKTFSLTQNKAFLAKIPGNFRYFGEDWHFLFIEFSESMIQWLDTEVTIVELSEVFIEMLREFIADNKTRELTVVQNAKMAFSLFLDIKEEIQKEIQYHYNAEKIQAAKEYIDEYYFEDINLDFLSEKYEISKYKLIRQFELAYKFSPIYYLKRVRIFHSLSLLWEDEAVEIVAKKVGFSTGNYFSKVFKKNMGISPSEYKNKKTRYY